MHSNEALLARSKRLARQQKHIIHCSRHPSKRLTQSASFSAGVAVVTWTCWTLCRTHCRSVTHLKHPTRQLLPFFILLIFISYMFEGCWQRTAGERKAGGRFQKWSRSTARNQSELWVAACATSQLANNSRRTAAPDPPHHSAGTMNRSWWARIFFIAARCARHR